ncbi:DUF393 domain-containing protein [Pseudoalteromonas sp. MMG010]|uniref:thiol-disulfide oxidoreductase DCC family protein n=1 Tax=Pseudoalteromonas sp. MMG010 TaxID=2822685 RepID=UPI001B3A4A8D|nr:DUF393 domain-containing protein [Pseudoalteromonas sp. MMG010]MBQ4833385.1 DUF393 domain-containing protein [Pseudoalteromonas sp. MMG010]
MIVFYDGNCPLCSTEMRKLKQADYNNNIVLEDINAPDFEQRFNYIKREDALRFLHGQTNEGEMLYGLDVTIKAWATVGKHKWLNILKLPLINIFADIGYWLFAKYRQPIVGIFCRSSCGLKR